MIGFFFLKKGIVKRERSRNLYSRNSDYATRQVFALQDFVLRRKAISRHANRGIFLAFLLPAVAVGGRRSDLLKVPFFFTKKEYTKFNKAKRKAWLAGRKNDVFSSWKSYLI